MLDYPLADDQLLAQIRDRISKTTVAHLITIGPEGYPRARGMEDHNVGEDFIFYFATDASTRKVAEIQANPHVSVAYYHLKSRDYICVFGRAEVVMDDAERGEQWRDGWECYWPAGPTDPGYALVRVVAEAIEYFDMENERLRKVSIYRRGAGESI